MATQIGVTHGQRRCGPFGKKRFDDTLTDVVLVGSNEAFLGISMVKSNSILLARRENVVQEGICECFWGAGVIGVFPRSVLVVASPAHLAESSVYRLVQIRLAHNFCAKQLAKNVHMFVAPPKGRPEDIAYVDFAHRRENGKP